MPKIVTVTEMKAIETAADKAGVTYAMMMEAAGMAVAQAVLARLENPADHKVVVLCGPGNNGGDGMVAAYHLAEAGAGSVALYFSKMPDENDPNLQRVRQKGLFVVDAENDQRWRVLKNLIGGVTVLIDAVFGTGVRLPLKGTPAEMLRQMKKALEERAALPLRVAVDCPSGLNCDTGELDDAAIPAELTVTFAAAKRGQFAFPAADALGELIVADIGIRPDMPELAGVKLEMGTAESVRALLPARPRHAHKGTFGRALIAAGSVNFTGAAYLAGAAAYRIGAGLVTLAVPTPIYPVLAAQLPEATWIMLPHEMGVIAGGAAEVLANELDKSQALLVGPGFGMEKETAAFLRRLLHAEEAGGKGQMGFAHRGEAQASEKSSHAVPLPPLVVDADGLKLLAPIEGWPRLVPPGTVLTPHPGEMGVLTGLAKDDIQSDRIGVAQKFAAEWGHVVVLKGAFTVVAAPDGRATVQPFATAALARAGTGDVLAGAIAGLLAQGLTPYEAAVAGTFLHGLAGVLAARSLGTTASVLARDVLEALPEALVEVAA
jgi:ADP-dependent NAD(P)H-hydrate dehydratase / NAD(P)H-hydrate epimerase